MFPQHGRTTPTIDAPYIYVEIAGDFSMGAKVRLASVKKKLVYFFLIKTPANQMQTTRDQIVGRIERLGDLW